MEQVSQLAGTVNQLSGTVNHFSRLLTELEEQLYQLLEAHLRTARLVERHEQLLQQLTASGAGPSRPEPQGTTEPEDSGQGRD